MTIPRKATIVIHELIGDVGGEEGVVAAIVDARARHMRMDSSASAPARSIPARTRTLIAPCEYPDVDYCRHVAAPLLEGPGQSKALKLQNVPDRTRLAPPRPSKICASRNFDRRCYNGSSSLSSPRDQAFGVGSCYTWSSLSVWTVAMTLRPRSRRHGQAATGVKCCSSLTRVL